MERVNTTSLLPQGKYDVSRMLEAPAPAPAPPAAPAALPHYRAA